MKEHLKGEKLYITKQQELNWIRNVVECQPISELKMQFTPQLVFDKAIQTEMLNYEEQNSFETLSIQYLPRNSNIISSHHFFKDKHDGEAQKLKLKLRLVPHDNRNLLK